MIGRLGRHLDGRWLLLACGPLLLFSIIYVLPILQLFRGSLDRFDPITGSIPDVHIGFYWKFLTDSFYLGVLWRTVWLSLVITSVCAVAGYPLAYFLVRGTSRLRKLLLIVLVIPLV